MSSDIQIQVDGFGFLPVNDFELVNSRQIVRRYTLTNKNNASVQLISWGAGIQSIRIPNNENILGDVVLGYDSIDGYLKNRLIGRIVNRIGENKKYQFSKNETNSGFDNTNWDSYVIKNQVVMSHLSRSKDKENLLIQVKYSWTNENELHLNIQATTTKPIPANITNYCLFNLAGHATGPKELNNHIVTINADKWTFSDTENKICPVDYTIFDLRRPTQLNKKRLFNVPGGGYNNNFRISSPSSCCYRFHARILHPSSGRFLEVFSNQQDLEFYTGNNLPNPECINSFDVEDYVWEGCGDSFLKNQKLKFKKNAKNETLCKGGFVYKKHSGFALTPQNNPVRLNEKKCPSYILCPGKTYNHDLTYKFGVLKKN